MLSVRQQQLYAQQTTYIQIQWRSNLTLLIAAQLEYNVDLVNAAVYTERITSR